jgi:hypothetical protein
MLITSQKDFYMLNFKEVVKQALNLSINEEIINIIITPKPSLTSAIYQSAVQIKSKQHIYKRNLFIKISSANMVNAYHELCIKETEFYNLIPKYRQCDILPRCYFSSYDPENDITMLVLEDLSDNYFTPDMSSLTKANINQSCFALAKFHSHFWNVDDLDNVFETNNNIQALLEQSEMYIQLFLKDNHMYLTKKIIENILISHKIYSDMIRDEALRCQTNNNITLLNGDAHIFNFMLPKDKNRTQKIIDYQFWRIGLGCYDLAHFTRKLIGFISTKKQHEIIVKQYHTALFQNGIKNYTYNQCLDDYRMCVASLVLNPIWQYSKFGIPFDKCMQPMDNLIKTFKSIYIT